MKKLIVLLSALALAVPVLATEVVQATLGGEPGTSVNLGSGGRGTVVYSNVTTYLSARYSAAQGTEVGDELLPDMSLVPAPGPGQYYVIDSAKFSYSNMGTLPIKTATMTMRFYDSFNSATPTYLGGVVLGYDYGATPLPVNSTSLFTAPPLATYNIPVPPAHGGVTYLLATLEFTGLDSTGAPTGNIGQRLYNPPTVGSSANDFWQGPYPGGWSWFGSTGPVANFYWEIDIALVPEPAAVALLAIGGLALLRRR